MFWPLADGLRFSLARGNPGVGGTFFTTIQFAMLLARHRPDWEVFLVHSDQILTEDSPSNLRVLVHHDLQGFIDHGGLRAGDIVISPSFMMRGVRPGTFAKCPATNIAWSRHPFDLVLRQLAQETKNVHAVCVGEYQWHSNRTCGLPVHFIQEIYLGPGSSEAPRQDVHPRNPVNAVHLSSLTPPKGFLDVARAWPALKVAFPGIRLHVIGGASLYGAKERTALIPARTDFARQILQYIPTEDIHLGRVIFYGTLGNDKNEIIRNCDFAILNPTGHSEAFPASPLEMMSLGVPVIASDDFGMADCMRFFPELSVSGSALIADRARWLVSRPTRYRALGYRSLGVARRFAAKTPQLLEKWVLLIKAISSSEPVPISLQPEFPLHGSLIKLVYRRDIRPVLRKCKRFLFPLKRTGASQRDTTSKS